MNRSRGFIILFIVLVLAGLGVCLFSFGSTRQVVDNAPSPSEGPDTRLSTPSSISNTEQAAPVFTPNTVVGPSPTMTPTLTLERTSVASATVPVLEATSVITSTALTVLPEGNSAAASLLQAQHSCGANGVYVSFTWQPGQGQTGQVVDISIFNNDFQTGTFSSSELIPPERNSYLWEGLADGVTYVWRVRSQVGSVWAPSGTEFFATSICGGDNAGP